MVTSELEGTEVFNHLQSSLQDVREVLTDCQNVALGLDSRMKDLVSRRGEALLKLAQIFLPEVSRPAIEATFEAIRSDLLAILARQEARIKELHAESGKAAEEFGRRNSELDGVTHRLNDKVAQRGQLEARVTEALKANDEFKTRSELALQAEERLHRDEERAADMANEAARKLPEYRKSRLFNYLLDRGFTTSQYKGTGWAISIDRWVAGLIHFADARNGYEFLTKTPELVAAEVARRREQFAELMQQVEAIQKAEADLVGLTAVLQEGDALGTERDRLVQESEQTQQRAQAIQQELSGLERSQNQFYNQAIDRFRAFLGETKLAVLQLRAKLTPEPEDDEIVAEIAQLDRQIDELSPQLADLDTRRKTAERTLTGLDTILRRYRQANYDSQRSYFEPALDFRRRAAEFEDGAIEADAFWEALKTSQRFRPNWVQNAAVNSGEFLASPSGRMLLGAILDFASASMRAAAYRVVERRGDIYPQSPPIQQPSRPSSSGSSRRQVDDGFTSGEGF